MLPRPTRTVATPTLAPIGRDDLPDFLFEDDEPTPVEEAPVKVEERWSEPFASGEALSDKVMSYGRKTPAPIDNLPHSAMRRGRKHRSA